MVLGVVGLTMATIQYASADNYTITATVPGDTLTAPAVITSPSDGVVVNDPNITVRGTCQMVNSGTYVTIMRGADSLGTAQCQSDSTFSLGLTLLLGDNTLKTTEVTGSNGSGPDGADITVTYVIPPVPPPPVSGGATTPAPTIPQASAGTPPVLAIKPEGPTFVQRSTDKLISLVFVVENGATPYTIEADWGDGKIDTVQQTSAGIVRLQHLYTTAGAFAITLRAIDAKGQKATFQYVALVQAPLALSTPAIVPPSVSYSETFRSLTLISRAVWIAYGLISFAVISLWLVSPTHSLLTGPLLASVKIRSTSRRR